MIVNKRYFPEITLDNDEIFLAHLNGVLSSVDEFASMEIVKTPSAYHFRIAPSHPKYSQPLLQEVLKFSNMYNMKLTLSKSIRRLGTIVFDIPVNN